MIDFRTKKTRNIFKLSIIYILLLPLIYAILGPVGIDLRYPSRPDDGLLPFLVIGLEKIGDFIRFYTNSMLRPDWQTALAYIYLTPLALYWIIFPLIRTFGRWVDRGQ